MSQLDTSRIMEEKKRRMAENAERAYAMAQSAKGALSEQDNRVKRLEEAVVALVGLAQVGTKSKAKDEVIERLTQLGFIAEESPEEESPATMDSAGTEEE